MLFTGVKTPGGQGWIPLVLEMTRIQISPHLTYVRCFMGLWGDTRDVRWYPLLAPIAPTCGLGILSEVGE